MRIEELNGFRLKKILKMDRVIKSYHNKHVDHSGNFGFVIVKVWKKRNKDESLAKVRISDETWFMLDGDYNAQGEITSLKFGRYSDAGKDVNHKTFEGMVKDVNEIIGCVITELVEQTLRE